MESAKLVLTIATFGVAVYVAKQVNKIGVQMSANQDKINALTEQVTKVRNEVLGLRDTLLEEVQVLKDQIAAGETLDFSALDAAIGDIDNIVPDPTPVEPDPVPETPAEPEEDNPFI